MQRYPQRRNAVLTCALCAVFLSAVSAQSAEYPGLEGKIVKELRFQDKSGENVVVLTEEQKAAMLENSWNGSKDLRAYRYRLQNGQATQMWKIYDYVHDCDLDLTAAFLKDEIAITDLDDNGQSEIWVPYVLHCAGDVSPYTMKIIMYEGNTKHALRGKTCLPEMEGYAAEPGEGAYKADAALQQAKPAIRKYGEQLWQRALQASLQVKE